MGNPAGYTSTAEPVGAGWSLLMGTCTLDYFPAARVLFGASATTEPLP